MSLPRIVLRTGKDKGLLRGYPWVFANQIDRRSSDRPDRGAAVRIEGPRGHAFGIGLYHDESLIAVRFLTTDLEAQINAEFFRRRVARAVALRKAAFPESTHVRLLFGESDGMPGTVVDRYGPPGFQGGVLTWSCLSFGMEQYRETILESLDALLKPDAIVERNDNNLRGKDGLVEATGVIAGSFSPPIEIAENGARFAVDPLTGPKTGFFIDQRLNRASVRTIAAGRRVLDVFSADGGFALQAALGGAKHVHMIDSSAEALERATSNAERSGVADRVSAESADALDLLGQWADQGADHDMIVLDPPSFASSRRHAEAATRAYQRINISALRILPPGGILATGSCSQAIDEDSFFQIIRYSARRAETRLRVLFRGTQPADHPVLETMPETAYLKFAVFQKLEDEVPA